MSDLSQQQFIRKGTLIVAAATGEGLDLSDMHFKFSIAAADVQSPNNAAIRIYNLSDDTVQAITGKKNGVEYTRVVVQAGYEKKNSFGVIFDGTIKQFKFGHERNVDSYLDLLAADGDLGYNFGICNHTFPAGSTPSDAVVVGAAAMNMPIGYFPPVLGVQPTLARGKVAFGMARDLVRNASQSIGSSWSIQDGKIQVVPLTGYIPGDAVVLNSATGMVGFPELTDQGVRVRTLLNPNYRIGTLAKIDNKSINQLAAQSQNSANVPFNVYRGIQPLAKISADGYYRIYVAEYQGDTRGNDWYADLTCIAVDISSRSVPANGPGSVPGVLPEQ